MKKALKQQNNLTVLSVSESDRTRFLQQLHDGMGQMLAAMNMQLSIARKSLPGNDALQQSVKLMTAMNKEYRDFCHHLLPPPAECTGIEEAFRLLCKRVETETPHTVGFMNHHFSGPLPAESVLGAYRILQELMNYVVHHAGQAAVIEAGMWERDQLLHLFIRVPGITGKAAANAAKHRLPENIFIRAELLGGRLHTGKIKSGGINTLLVIPVK